LEVLQTKTIGVKETFLFFSIVVCKFGRNYRHSTEILRTEWASLGRSTEWGARIVLTPVRKEVAVLGTLIHCPGKATPSSKKKI
jgi:hypothetical protein